MLMKDDYKGNRLWIVEYCAVYIFYIKKKELT